MSIPSSLNADFLKFTQHRDLADLDEYAKGLFTLMNGFYGVGAVETFVFVDCSYDRDDSTLYARFKPYKNASPDNDVYLSRIDTSDMQIAINTYKQVDVLPEYSKFMERLEQQMSRAVKEMNIHEKTVEWLNERDTNPPSAQEDEKNPLLLSRCTL